MSDETKIQYPPKRTQTAQERAAEFRARFKADPRPLAPPVCEKMFELWLTEYYGTANRTEVEIEKLRNMFYTLMQRLDQFAAEIDCPF